MKPILSVKLLLHCLSTWESISSHDHNTGGTAACPVQSGMKNGYQFLHKLQIISMAIHSLHLLQQSLASFISLICFLTDPILGTIWKMPARRPDDNHQKRRNPLKCILHPCEAGNRHITSQVMFVLHLMRHSTSTKPNPPVCIACGKYSRMMVRYWVMISFRYPLSVKVDLKSWTLALSIPPHGHWGGTDPIVSLHWSSI